METKIVSQEIMSLTSIHENITFSPSSVWSWFDLTALAKDKKGFREQVEAATNSYSATQKAETHYHIIVSHEQNQSFPTVLLGVKIGTRGDTNAIKIIPPAVDNFINLIADAPVNDYLSSKELEYWESLNTSLKSFFLPLLTCPPAAAQTIIHTIRKRFHPSMSVPQEYFSDQNIATWGESEIASLVKSNITQQPKYLAFTQDIGSHDVIGYTALLDVAKISEDITVPFLNLWAPHLEDFPFPVSFSLRFSIQGKSVSKKPKKTYQDYKIIVEAPTTEDLTTKVDEIIYFYREIDCYVSWSTGNQLQALKEALPNGDYSLSPKKKNKSALAVNRIYEDITFSKHDVWVWVEVPPAQYEFLDGDSRIRLAREMDAALSNLVTSDEKNIECHMLVSSRPFDSVAWIRNLNDKVEEYNPNEYNNTFLYNMYQHVSYQEFREKIVLLGVNIGKRASYSPNKSLTPTFFETVFSTLTAPPVSEEMSEKELLYWKQIARTVSFALQASRLGATPASTQDIAFAIRKNFFPNMPAPTPEDLSVGIKNHWGKNEVEFLADAQIENHPKFLKITQNIHGEEITGYRATLCFRKFPDIMHFPQQEPWIHSSALLPFHVDFSLRFTLEPSRKVRKEVDKKLKEAQDQAKNMTEAGGNASLEVQEHINLGTELDYYLKKDNTPWIFGRYRLVVEGATEEELKEKVGQVIDHYRNMEIFVVWPTGDQLSLLKEGLPNDKVQVPSYYQRQEVSIIGAGMPAGSGTTGDAVIYKPDGTERGYIGPYLGYTTGLIQEPVFLSIHSAIDADQPNGLVITGSPGGGKTFAAETLCYQMVLSGAWTIYIDPKADALEMSKLPGLEDTKIIDLRNGNDGILDPFSIGLTLSDQMALAIEVIGLFLGGIDTITDEQNIALSNAIETMVRYPDVSLSSIVDYLKESPNADAKSLGTKLHTIRQLPFAQLCFSKNTSQTILNPADGLTIITLLGLELPAADTKKESYTNGNRLAVGVMYLLSSYTRQLMLAADKSQAKAIVIDEAWAITSTEQGAALVSSVARMGRSHNTGLILVSQNAGDFNGSSVTNSVSTKLAFRANTPPEIEDVIAFLNLEPSDSNRETIRGLKNGECLIQDWKRRIARVKVDGWDEGMRRAFETNPHARKNQ